ncbi:hypothetical protein T07_14878 [Trichinella nelsoni]|uniref:Uncharacterized protein n=1 Tax=Trichinella nelsoni TaxID=6336 RepID=A0A0V0RMD1_9BILA|nr:hypothetical protein T07_14878 [Trichinella nelsoni]
MQSELQNTFMKSGAERMRESRSVGRSVGRLGARINQLSALVVDNNRASSSSLLVQTDNRLFATFTSFRLFKITIAVHRPFRDHESSNVQMENLMESARLANGGVVRCAVFDTTVERDRRIWVGGRSELTYPRFKCFTVSGEKKEMEEISQLI